MVRIIEGDCREALKTFDAGLIQCCVTSPPYWGLRDYGTAAWEGGSLECDHCVDRFATPVSDKQASNAASGSKQARTTCPKCGARRVDSQLGLEPTPEEYVANMVAVFREVRRVLADDGTLWLNLGTSYAAGKAGRTDDGSGDPTSTLGPKHNGLPNNSGMGPTRQRKPPLGWKAKDMVPIPWLVALALQADGWWLRQDIIWHKPNPMPESVTDRCTKAHEYIFLLSKSARYYYDADAVKEPVVCGWKASRFETGKTGEHQFGRAQKIRPSAARGSFNGKTEVMADAGQNAFRAVTEYRNLRSVWTVPTKPYKGAHFATFPPALIRPCILAGCPMGGTVLDPFGGSGTVGMVAEEEGRNSVLIELNAEYVELAKERTRQQGLFCVQMEGE